MPFRPFEGYYQNPYAPIPGFGPGAGTSPDTSTRGAPGRPSYTVFQPQPAQNMVDLGAFATLPQLDFSEINDWLARQSGVARKSARVQLRRNKTNEGRGITDVINNATERGIFSSGIRLGNEKKVHTDFARNRQDIATKLAETLANLRSTADERRNAMTLNYANQYASTPPPPGTYPGGREAIVKMGQQLAAARGWTDKQWNALYRLWLGESGWNPYADNPSSSAYGIPQALTDMHHPGAAYMKGDPRAQILWGLDYIARRYGDPLRAFNFWTRNRWY